MRILHVNMSSSGGGLEQYLSQLFIELDSRGHTNLLLYGENSPKDFSLPKVKAFFIEDITYSRCQDLTTKLKLVQTIIDQEQPDIILLHELLNIGLIDLLTRQKPSVRFVHGFKMICPDGGKTLKTIETVCPFPLSYLCQLRAYGYRCMPRNPLLGMPLIYRSKKMRSIHKDRSQMVVASGFMKSVLINNGFEVTRISVIPIFTDIPKPGPQPVPSKEPMILAVGRIVPAKGMDYLLRAFSLIKEDIRLTIAGDGPQLPDLKSIAKELGISSRVNFTGWLNHDELDNLYRSCTLVVVPSIWPESFGMVGIEAMAYAKPVVAFDVGGISEWLENEETGFLIKPLDEACLADKIHLLITNPDLCMRMGLKGKYSVTKRFTAEIHVKKILSVLQWETTTFKNRR